MTYDAGRPPTEAERLLKSLYHQVQTGCYHCAVGNVPDAAGRHILDPEAGRYILCRLSQSARDLLAEVKAKGYS